MLRPLWHESLTRVRYNTKPSRGDAKTAPPLFLAISRLAPTPSLSRKPAWAVARPHHKAIPVTLNRSHPTASSGTAKAICEHPRPNADNHPRPRSLSAKLQKPPPSFAGREGPPIPCLAGRPARDLSHATFEANTCRRDMCLIKILDKRRPIRFRRIPVLYKSSIQRECCCGFASNRDLHAPLLASPPMGFCIGQIAHCRYHNCLGAKKWPSKQQNLERIPT